jgi:hypothetical protein
MAHRPVLVGRRYLLLIRAVAVVGLTSALLIFAYNPEQDDVNNAPVATRWQNNSVIWNLNPTIGTNVQTGGGDDIPTALGKAFDTWRLTPLNGQVVTALTVIRGPDSAKTTPDTNTVDCANVVGFTDSNTKDFPTGTIAFTSLFTQFGNPPTTYQCSGNPNPQICSLASCIIDADIEFNPAEPFSTAATTPPASFDIQSVATHEIGHMLGMDHSGIAHTVMYPFGDTSATGIQRTLAVDDAAGIAFLYHTPGGSFDTSTGIISGQVTLNSSGIFAAHVIAIDATPGSATIGSAVIDGLTDTAGNYRLVGLPPGTYNVLALPLAPDINSGLYSLSNFSGWSCGFASTAENSPPCCDPTQPSCTGTPENNPTNYTGKFF